MNYRPIQRVLVPLDTSGYSKAATARACEIAKSHFAQVTGLAVLDTPDIVGSVVPGELGYWPLVEDTISQLTEFARERIAVARSDFAGTCEHNSVSHLESQLEGVPSNRILEASILYDLVVIGVRTFFHFESLEESGHSLSQLLGRTVTPVLAVPDDKEAATFKKVVIAYDGSFSAGRALRDFIGFALPYDLQITIVTASKSEKQAEHLLNDAKACLLSHDIENVETLHIQGSTLSAVDTRLINEADLVVTGIHSQHFMKDLFVGSFAREMIDRGNKALFLSH